ncbi:hypothetical protein CEP45_07945 [Mergibacter septicus]|uniref:peptidase domain-containing ABC transporter n=1 Tax=Mergibacter septicus TaxID=221402 RepID=UPI001C74A22F|nr:peptidase domain-containing ABC transporter [Mergibacter septicus]QDJ13772.1 hypothetical protein CEP45_07945 [Mergibacter septicus]
MKENKNLSLSLFRSVPMIFQNSAADCAISCVMMIANYYHKYITYERIKQIIPNYKQGCSINDIIQLLEKLELTAFPFSLEQEEVQQLNLPTILHWDHNHFVVLVAIKNKKYIIHDPDKGILKLNKSKFNQHFSGVAINITNNTHLKFIEDKKEKTRSVFHFLKGIKNIKPTLSFILILLFMLEFINLTLPQLTQITIDQVLTTNDENLLYVVTIAYFLLLCFQLLFTITRDWGVIWISANINLDWSISIFRHIHSLYASFFNTRSIGDIISRINSLEKIKDIITTQFVSAILDSLIVVISLIIMFAYSKFLSLVIILITITYFILKLLYLNLLRSLNVSVIRSKSRQQSLLIESIKNNLIFRLYSNHTTLHNNYINATTELVNQQSRLELMNIFTRSINLFLAGIRNIAILFIGGKIVIHQGLTIGMFVAFIAYAEQFSVRASKLVDYWLKIKMISAHITRIDDILTSPQEKNKTGNNRIIEHISEIELRNIYFTSDNERKSILKNINLRITSGQTILIKGYSGSGKSSLIKLILGLVEPSHGELLFNGLDYSQIGKDQIRKIAGVVLQENGLLTGNILYNITLDTSSTIEDVIELTQKLGIHSIIDKLPMGYFTYISDAGNILSGGQIQKIIIARALFKQPSLLIFDEATSNLDHQSELQVNNVIMQSPAIKIIISHKNEIGIKPDIVIIMHEGQIVKLFDNNKDNSTVE